MPYARRSMPIVAAAICLFSTVEVMAQEQVYSHVAGRYIDVQHGSVPEPASEKAYGTGDLTAVSKSALTFSPYSQTDGGFMLGHLGLRYCSSSCTLIGTFQLPTGVRLTHLTLDYTDPDASGRLTANLFACPRNNAGCDQLTSIVSIDDGDSTITNTVNHTVDSLNNSYIVDLQFVGGTSAYAVGNITLHYRRQVSPAPGSATFGDVPTGHPFFQHVEALAASGVTAGCGGGDYCPGNAVTRGQLAVFLATALGLHWPD